MGAKPDFQRFPTVEELLDTQHPHPFLQLAPQPPPRPASQGLLQELLGGRLDVLISDAQRHPERYDKDTGELLAVLGSDPSKMGKMNPTEEQMLNRAVIDYAAFKPKPKPPAAPAPKPKLPRVLANISGEDNEPPDGEDHGAGSPMSSYWWTNHR